MDMTLQSLLTKFLLEVPLEVPVKGLGILRAAGSQQER